MFFGLLGSDKVSSLSHSQQSAIAGGHALSFVQTCFNTCASYAKAVTTGLSEAFKQNSIMPFLGGIFTGPVPIILGAIMAVGTTLGIMMKKRGDKKRAECQAAQNQQQEQARYERNQPAEKIPSPTPTPHGAVGRKAARSFV